MKYLKILRRTPIPAGIRKFQNQQRKYQNYVWNLFKIINKDTVRIKTAFLTLVSLLLTWNRFETLTWCFHFWLWTSKCRLRWSSSLPVKLQEFSTLNFWYSLQPSEKVEAVTINWKRFLKSFQFFVLPWKSVNTVVCSKIANMELKMINTENVHLNLISHKTKQLKVIVSQKFINNEDW